MTHFLKSLFLNKWHDNALLDKMCVNLMCLDLTLFDKDEWILYEICKEETRGILSSARLLRDCVEFNTAVLNNVSVMR